MASTQFVKENVDKLPNFFNWTMTYRLDSDIPYPYKYLRRNLNWTNIDFSGRNLDWDQIWAKKKATPIVWLNSNCYTVSKREDYTKELQKHIGVDIYGECGNLTCSKGEYDKCNEMIAEYKFYLAFENAICKDYISEKLWGRISIPSIPIVLKRAIYTEAYPSSAFIAADDFSTVQQLAQYINYLSTNKSAYLQYFDWMNEGYYFEGGSGFCKLCEELHKPVIARKSYPSLWEWWADGSHCDADLVPKLLKG